MHFIIFPKNSQTVWHTIQSSPVYLRMLAIQKYMVSIFCKDLANDEFVVYVSHKLHTWVDSLGLTTFNDDQVWEKKRKKCHFLRQFYDPKVLTLEPKLGNEEYYFL